MASVCLQHTAQDLTDRQDRSQLKLSPVILGAFMARITTTQRSTRHRNNISNERLGRSLRQLLQLADEIIVPFGLDPLPAERGELFLQIMCCVDGFGDPVPEDEQASVVGPSLVRIAILAGMIVPIDVEAAGGLVLDI